MPETKLDARPDYAGKTDVGCVRSNNEDNFGSDQRAGIYVVCDGMGGHAAGEVASHIAVQSVIDFFRAERPAQAPAEALLHEAVLFANHRVYQAAHSEESRHGMGTTLVALALNYPSAEVANVGDSRAYLLRGVDLTQITNDHSLVMEQVRRGVLTLEEAKNSSVQNIILRALGSEPEVDVELHEVALQPGDTVLLTTDGLCRHVNDEQIATILQGAASSELAVNALIEAAKKAGGEDNITCIVLRT